MEINMVPTQGTKKKRKTNKTSFLAVDTFRGGM